MEVKQVLISEFLEEVESLKCMDPGSEEFSATIESVDILAKRIEEIERREAEMDNINETRKLEKRDRNIKNAITVATAIGGGALSLFFYLSGMAYDKDGVMPTLEGTRVAIRNRFNKSMK